MSIHIEAKEQEIAESILLPGDPKRAEFIAKEFLEGVNCYNRIRGMLGFTGVYKGVRVSVQGTGMGQPSLGIYVNELIQSYKVQNLVRIGSCGSLQSKVNIRDIIVALSASTDSGMNVGRMGTLHYAPSASAVLLEKAFQKKSLVGASNIHFGGIVSTDTFYHDDPEEWKKWAQFNVLAVEMEAAQLYTLAAKYKREALTILTVSDSLITHQETSALEREQGFTTMMEYALSIVTS